MQRDLSYCTADFPPTGGTNCKANALTALRLRKRREHGQQPAILTGATRSISGSYIIRYSYHSRHRSYTTVLTHTIRATSRGYTHANTLPGDAASSNGTTLRHMRVQTAHHVGVLK